MIEKSKVPEGIVNFEAYQKFLEISENPIIKDRNVMLSTGEVISVGALPHRFRQLISHLPPQEQERLLEHKEEYARLLGAKGMYKSLAYGTRETGRKSLKEQVKSLTPFEADIVELLGRLYTVPEVIKIMAEENDIPVDEDEIREVLRKNITIIEKKRDEFRAKVTDVRLYNKRSRLEELSWMYSKMKSRYIALQTSDAYNNMLRTLEQIRKEAEGDVLNINASLDVNIEATIQEQIYKETLKTINIKEIILGRVAARMNYDTKLLVQGLHNSYYAKHISISGAFDPDATLEYPSAQPYDFDKIESLAEREAVDITPEELTEEEANQAKLIKEAFLAKIKKVREEEETRRSGADLLGEMKKSRDVEKEDRYRRAGGWRTYKDKKLPSKSTSKYKDTSRDYRTGEKISKPDAKK